MFSIKYHSKAIKQIKKLHVNDRKKIVKKISILKRIPHSSTLDIKRYQNTKNSWRLKVGSLRIIYQIDIKNKLILIRKVGYRGNIYKN